MRYRQSSAEKISVLQPLNYPLVELYLRVVERWKMPKFGWRKNRQCSYGQS